MEQGEFRPVARRRPRLTHETQCVGRIASDRKERGCSERIGIAALAQVLGRTEKSLLVDGQFLAIGCEFPLRRLCVPGNSENECQNQASARKPTHRAAEYMISHDPHRDVVRPAQHLDRDDALMGGARRHRRQR